MEIKFSSILVIGIICCMQNPTQGDCPDPPYNCIIAKEWYKLLDNTRDNIENGFPKWSIPPLDPFYPNENIPLEYDSKMLRLVGSINDTVIYNLSKYIICQIDVFLFRKSRFFINLRLEDFIINSNYDFDGAMFQLLPVYGNGTFEMVVQNASLSSSANFHYGIHTRIENLQLNLTFDNLKLNMECLYGCGPVSDFINSYLDDIATYLFDTIWNTVSPALCKTLEKFINHILSTSSYFEELDSEELYKLKVL